MSLRTWDICTCWEYCYVLHQGRRQLLRSGVGEFSLKDRVCCTLLSFGFCMCNAAYNLFQSCFSIIISLINFGRSFVVTACTCKIWGGLSFPSHLENTLVYGGNDLSYTNWPKHHSGSTAWRVKILSASLRVVTNYQEAVTSVQPWVAARKFLWCFGIMLVPSIAQVQHSNDNAACQ